MRSSNGRLSRETLFTPSMTKPSLGPSTRMVTCSARSVSRENAPSKSRTKGPSALEAVLSFAMPSRRALRPSTSRRFTSLPRVAPRARPVESTTRTSSGSGLFHEEKCGMPTWAPYPTEERTGALVNTSGCGPRPTSRYCDHSPSATKTSLTRCAAAVPGCTPARGAPPHPVVLRRGLQAAPRRLRHAGRHLDRRDQRAEEDRDDGRALLPAGEPARRRGAGQPRRGRPRHGHDAELLPHRDQPVRAVGLHPGAAGAARQLRWPPAAARRAGARAPLRP